MSANNFYNVNAKYIYSVEYNENEYEYLIDDIKDIFKAKFGIEFFEDFSYSSASRDYNGIRFGYIVKTIGHDEIIVDTIIRSGYYLGANLDWDMKFYIDGYHEYTMDDIHKYPKLQKEFNKVIDQVEDLYEKLSTPLNKVGSFSNGEAIYEKVDK